MLWHHTSWIDWSWGNSLDQSKIGNLSDYISPSVSFISDRYFKSKWRGGPHIWLWVWSRLFGNGYDKHRMLMFVGDICWECDGSRASFRFELTQVNFWDLSSFSWRGPVSQNPAWWHSKSGSISSKYIFVQYAVHGQLDDMSCLFVILSASIHVKAASSPRLVFRPNQHQNFH